MKRCLCVLLIAILVMTCAACGDKPEAAAESAGIEATEAPASNEIDLSVPEEGDGDMQFAGDVSKAAQVTDVAAYIYEGREGQTLYCAIEYRNAGSEPIYVEKAGISFDVGGQPVACEYVPALAEYDVIAPGETSYLAYWHAVSGYAADSTVTAEVTLTAKAAEHERIPITVGDVFIADNYPGFATLSGTLTAGGNSEFSMNMVYVAMYDESDSLIAVWMFTMNALFMPGDEKAFVEQMRELPELGYGAVCARAEGTGFGF